jgi:hypothetical protein
MRYGSVAVKKFKGSYLDTQKVKKTRQRTFVGVDALCAGLWPGTDPGNLLRRTSERLQTRSPVNFSFRQVRELVCLSN